MTGLVQDAAPAIVPVETEVLLELDDLVVDYLEADRSLRAVDHVNLTIRAGEVVYDPAGMAQPLWEDAPPDYWIVHQPQPITMK